jgi:hypothetical protein
MNGWQEKLVNSFSGAGHLNRYCSYSKPEIPRYLNFSFMFQGLENF